MTTICVKDCVIAADTLSSGGNYAQHDVKKVYRVGKDLWLGLAGMISRFPAYAEWFEAGREDCPPDGVEALLMNRNGEVFLFEEGERDPIPSGKQAAIGSGASHAITAMDCGKSAKEAVIEAHKRDSTRATGPRVKAYGPRRKNG